jgi:hypothetical protein
LDDTVISPEGGGDLSVAWIAAHAGSREMPRMPSLEVRMAAAGEDFRVQARLEVCYERPYVGMQPDDRIRFPLGGGVKELRSGEVWRIWEEFQNLPFFGGDAVLIYQVTAPVSGPSRRFTFRIAGENPDDDLCKAYILAYATDFAARLKGSRELARHGLKELPAMWFAYAIAKSESDCYNGAGESYNQFWNRPGTKSNCNSGVTYSFRKGDPLVIRTKGENSAGGNGMFQVTGNARDYKVIIPREQLWDWRENVHAAFDIFQVKQIGAQREMAARRVLAESENKPMPPHQVQGVTFADGTPRTMEDAVTIKRYNGKSKSSRPDGPVPEFFTGTPRLTGDYCYWHEGRKQWSLSRMNGFGHGFNYVERVCGEVDD